MPTTRFASAQNPEETAANETVQEIRNKRFNSRKKREGYTAQTPKQRAMMQFLSTIIDYDKQHILWTEPKEHTAITIESIEDRVYKGKYKTFDSFKNDIDALFLSVVPSIQSSKEEMNTFKQLYQFAQGCLKFESERLNENIQEGEQSIYKVVALFRPSVDGYVFSDTTIKEPTAPANDQLPQNVHEMIIHPSQPVQQEEVPSLKQTIAPPPKYPPKLMKHEDKPVVPVQWLDFGAFSSFAPTYDSNNANVTYENTYIGRTAKRLKVDKIDEKDDENVDEMNKAWLEKEGLDVNLIEDAFNKLPSTVEEELANNCQLLEKLMEHQESRIEKGEVVDEEELKTAKLLEENIIKMLSRLPPNATANTELIEKTMENIPLCEPAYKGSLLPHKIFSYPTTEKAEVLPPYANLTPTYNKDHWRLVKVPPLATSDNSNNNTYPLLSMVEQQQINFYTKPPAFIPPQQFIQQQQQQQQQKMTPPVGQGFVQQRK
ncbi:hypothetical protein RMATCC62417_14155 [Rhizopus microsporus]|nr:hypothetical protein RMATCC62417_14155 [Rhizopus microsporus]